MQKDRELSLDELKAIVPAAFVEAPSPTVSKRYGFIPTFKLIASIMERGWRPFQARMQRSKAALSPLFATHLITFRQSGSGLIHVGGIMPTITLINNHMARMRAKIIAGFLRLICSNGLMISAGIGDSNVVRVHLGKADEFVGLALEGALDKLGRSTGQIESWKGLPLGALDQGRFASAALALRYPESAHKMLPSLLLKRRRAEDYGDDLWTTFNVVQENLTQGGVQGLTQNRRTTRAIQAVPSLVQVNQGLWALAEETYNGHMAIRA